MSDAVELKKLVKQLQTASNNEVRVISTKSLCQVRSVLISVFFQDITTILRTLKKDYKVNEAILRVGVARRFFFAHFPFGLTF
jgi:hypothetical protein